MSNRKGAAKKVVRKRAVAEQVASKYTFRVARSEPDKEYVGLCAEFPSLSHLCPTRTAAFDGIVELVDEVVQDMCRKGEMVPVGDG